ncbi:MAG: leucine-rich repeat domain-containing protein [Mycoplasmoidaceae bacterium]|nr:leucine-rich repeat domain-containing protein [Mycoplasmoidaceae bacterium]
MLDSTFGTQSTLQLIGNYAFHKAAFGGDCYIPNTVTTIGENAFQACTFDQNLYIAPFNKKANLTTIGQNAFSNCTFRGDLIIPESNNPITIKASAFQRCNFDGTLNISKSVKFVNANAFSYTTFKQVVFNQEETTLQLQFSTECFNNCGRLTGDLVIPNRCTQLKTQIFSHCDFTTISIPKDIVYNTGTSSGRHFAYNKKLSKLDLSRIDSIEDNLFADPETVTYAAPSNVFDKSGTEVTKLTVILNNNL